MTLLTIKEAAEYVRLSSWTIKRAIDAGEIAPVYRPRGQWRIPTASLDAWLESTAPAGAAVEPGAVPSRRRRSAGTFRSSLNESSQDTERVARALAGGHAQP